MEKMEQIGKAVLDYRFYPEDDKYTDGAIEDEMLEIARNCAPEQYERVIVEKKELADSLSFFVSEGEYHPLAADGRK